MLLRQSRCSIADGPNFDSAGQTIDDDAILARQHHLPHKVHEWEADLRSTCIMNEHIAYVLIWVVWIMLEVSLIAYLIQGTINAQS